MNSHHIWKAQKNEDSRTASEQHEGLAWLESEIDTLTNTNIVLSEILEKKQREEKLEKEIFKLILKEATPKKKTKLLSYYSDNPVITALIQESIDSDNVMPPLPAEYVDDNPIPPLPTPFGRKF